MGRERVKVAGKDWQVDAPAPTPATLDLLWAVCVGATIAIIAGPIGHCAGSKTRGD